MGAEVIGNQALGARIRQMRLDQGLMLAVLARRADISVLYPPETERGWRLPSLDVLARLASGLDRSVVDLIKHVAPFGRDA